MQYGTFVMILLIVITAISSAQSKNENGVLQSITRFAAVKVDTSYITDLSQRLSVRTFGSHNYIDFKLQDCNYFHLSFFS
jgi:hypothetical protein